MKAMDRWTDGHARRDAAQAYRGLQYKRLASAVWRQQTHATHAGGSWFIRLGGAYCDFVNGLGLHLLIGTTAFV